MLSQKKTIILQRKGKDNTKKVHHRVQGQGSLGGSKRIVNEGGFGEEVRDLPPRDDLEMETELVENAGAAFGAKSGTADFDKERDALHRKSASWRWTWIFASGYTSSWGYLYPKGTDISNERDCRQGRHPQ